MYLSYFMHIGCQYKIQIFTTLYLWVPVLYLWVPVLYQGVPVLYLRVPVLYLGVPFKVLVVHVTLDIY